MDQIQDQIFNGKYFTRNAQFAVAKATAPNDSQPTSLATLSGYAMTWNDLSDDRGGFVVRLLPGSAKFDVYTVALYAHDFASIIGNTQNGTLRIQSDDVGVKVEIDLPCTSVGEDVFQLVENKYVSGMSFLMTNPIGKMVTENGQKILNVSSFMVGEVTVTGTPAFENTSIAVADSSQTAPVSIGEMQASKNIPDCMKEVNALAWQLEILRLKTIGRDSGE